MREPTDVRPAESFDELNAPRPQDGGASADARALDSRAASPSPERPTPEKAAVAAASVRGVSKSFKGTRVLEDVSFDVSEGEALVLLGASGSGKTTILRIIAGLERPDAGRVYLHGRDVTELPARERGVGVIFQSYALFPRMTVEKNVGYGLRIRGRKRKEIRETVASLLKLVHLEEHRKKFPSQLSGGQQQRVAIARTLAYRPEVLLFDEPFGALDAQTRVRLRREIRALLREVNVPAIFITHDQEEALELGDRIAVLNVGRLEQTGTPEEVYDRPETEYVATFLGAANLLSGVARRARGEVEVAGGGAFVSAREQLARFGEGERVRLIIRPEDICLGPSEATPAGCQPLARGTVEEKHFVGAYERLRVRLDLGAAGETGWTESGAGHLTETGAGDSVTVLVTRPRPEASAAPLEPGDSVAVGLAAVRVLPDGPRGMIG